MAAKKEMKVVPYLTVSNGNKALEFYQAALGAKIARRMKAEDGQRLMHAEFVVNGHSIFLCDEFPEHGGKGGPEKLGGSPVYMHVILKKPADVDAWQQRAAKAGAKVTMPAADMFWGDRYGRVIDPFGHDWGFGATLPKPKKKKKAANKAAAKSKAAVKKPVKKKNK
jgi:PhnB protein